MEKKNGRGYKEERHKRKGNSLEYSPHYTPKESTIMTLCPMRISIHWKLSLLEGGRAINIPVCFESNTMIANIRHFQKNLGG